MKIIHNLKVLILAGGFGSRLSELTYDLPKPLVKIGKYPIILHIIRIYLSQGVKNFYIATGYKKNEFLKFFKFKKKYFNKKNKILSTKFKIGGKKCTINLIDTGKNSMTGGRVKESFKYIRDNIFLLTYGDGLANVNISKLLKFHLKKKKLVTVTAVNPTPRFGEITIKAWADVVDAFRRNDLVKASELGSSFLKSNYRTSPYQLLGVQVMLDLANADNPSVTSNVTHNAELRRLMDERDQLRTKYANLQAIITREKAVINRITINRTQAVQQGTQAFRECSLSAARIHQAETALAYLLTEIDRNKVKVSQHEVGTKSNLKNDTLRLFFSRKSALIFSLFSYGVSEKIICKIYF
jgi:glucose-1-phosphate cytidylyltransferase